MFLKSVILFLALGSIDALFFEDTDTCVTPRLAHGRVRTRQRSRLVRFTCLPRYQLVGNKYATCRNGEWDVPLPVCVRASCAVPKIEKGLSMLSYGGAWVIFFCFPNHELVGSPVIYCDGYKWNGTAPKCYDTTTPLKLSCDFEDPNLCGWRQDTLHDFDWTRINTKTPSSFHFTGPKYDHTLGRGENGHYMYIESSSQMENDTARLISPVYESSLTPNGCFSFSYHMYGKTCGGLRVYQKPDNISLRKILDMSEEDKQLYLLFEKWGNLGDVWFNAVSPLKNFSIDFQIVIEGIRGRSYTSDIAVDDVAILQGENCAAAANSATTPTPPTTAPPDSCVNRCIDAYVRKPKNDSSCSCSYACFIEYNCCNDFYDVCIFYDTPTADSNISVTAKSSTEDAPQTLKRIAITTESTTTTVSTTTAPTLTTTPRRLTTTTPKTTTRSRFYTSTTPFTTSTKQTTTLKLTTTRKPSPTYQPTSIYKWTSTYKHTTSTYKPTSTYKTTTTYKPTYTYKPTSTYKPTNTYKPTSTYKQTKTTTKFPPLIIRVIPITTTTVTSTAKVPTTTGYKVSKPIDNDNYLESVEKAKKEQEIERKHVNKNLDNEYMKVLSPAGEKSTSVKVIVIIMVLATLTAIAMAVHAGLRNTRVQIALARFRGRRNRDPEVRYLSSDVDDN